MKFIHFTLILICFTLLAPQASFAGGSDGSEVLGSYEEIGPKKEGGFFSKVKRFFSGKKDVSPKRRPLNSGRIDNRFLSIDKKEEEITEVLMDCKVTPYVMPSFIPLQKVRSENNLVRKTGSARRAKGNYIQFFGKIVDEDCLPVSNAIVQIWQTDAAGKHEANYVRESEWDTVDQDFDKHFGYTGSAQTDNLGQFSFLTIFPGIIPTKAPHINVLIKHPDFEELQTRIFFSKHPRNSTDNDFMSLHEDQKKLILAKGRKVDPNSKFEGRVYSTVITLKGLNRFRRY